MASCTIDDLPNEVILNIVYIGCEDERWDYVPVRRRKQFVCLARRISHRWLMIIDSIPEAWSRSFWITDLSLSAPETKDPGVLEPLHILRLDFVRDLARFQQGLRASKGCDLRVSFSVISSSPNAWHIRLLAHAMELLVPYHGQITALTYNGSGSYLHLHLLDMITNRWENAQRLAVVKIDFNNDDQLFKVHQAPRILEPLFHSRDVPFKSSSMAFSHLHHLDTLIIPGWLELTGGRKQLPADLSQLHLMHCELASGQPTMLMALNILSKQHPLCNNIKCIKVDRNLSASESTTLETAEPQADWQNIESSQACFSSLHSLALEGIALEVIQTFRHLNLPSLESLKLALKEDMHPTIEDAQQLEPIPFTSLDSDELQFDFQIRVPRLLKLEINQAELSFSAFLGLFRGQSIENVSLGYWTFGPDPKSDFKKSKAARALSHFCPRNLSLLGIDAPLISFVIASMDSKLLQSLVIRFHKSWPEPYGPFSLFEKQKKKKKKKKKRRTKNTIFEWYQSNMDFSLPLLASLSCDGSCRHIAEFLAHLDASRLTHLHMNCPSSDVENGWHSPPFLGLLPSVRFVAFRFMFEPTQSSNPTLMGFRDLLPNLEELSLEGLRYGASYTLHTLYPDGEGATPEEWQNTLLWNYLGITPEGSALFPRLRFLLVTVEYEGNWKWDGTSDFDHADWAIAETVSYRYIQGLLTLRHRYGALPLTLDELPKYIPPSSRYGTYGWGKMKFSAHYQSDG